MRYFIIFTIVELWLLIKVGSLMGATVTILWTILTALIGMNIFRFLGFEMLQHSKQQLFTKQIDLNMATIIFRLLTAIGLIIPGFISDLIGCVLLLPALQKWLITLSSNKSWVKNQKNNKVLEGEFERHK